MTKALSKSVPDDEVPGSVHTAKPVTDTSGHRPRERHRITYLGLILVGCFVLVPFLWMLIGSFKPTNELLGDQGKALLSSHFTVQNYVHLFKQYDYARYFANSALVAVVTALIATSISAFAGYALARFRFPGRGFAGFLILVTQMLPLIAVLIPLFIWFKSFNLIDTYSSLFIAYNAFAIPFSTWMLRGFFSELPLELEEAARVDGAGEFTIFFRIVLPISATGLMATAIFCFILAWQEFLFAITFISSGSKFTLTVGIAGMFGRDVVDWGLLDAGVVISTVPLAILFAVLQRFLVRGLTAGAVKG
ncbi:MAG: multiple sugar transport system permease protein [Pseudonocardiales bacterium]|jgi:ABC-type glycerol-3-phosphate transport system permease component|nr:multiple sugar transport system permease protein [Pseudonocardiales bacterium]